MANASLCSSGVNMLLPNHQTFPLSPSSRTQQLPSPVAINKKCATPAAAVGVSRTRKLVLPPATTLAPLAAARASSLRKEKHFASLRSFSFAPFQLKAA